MTRSTLAGLLALTVFSMGLLAACTNTLHGAGEDIEKAGQEVQKKTDD
ncbi:hypothetical protein T5B8_01690 [Salinisphaera sp. T5B8]